MHKIPKRLCGQSQNNWTIRSNFQLTLVEPDASPNHKMRALESSRWRWVEPSRLSGGLHLSAVLTVLKVFPPSPTAYPSRQFAVCTIHPVCFGTAPLTR